MGGVAWLVFRRHRRYALLLGPLALLVGHSRIYLGLHYPGDVLGGFALGTLLAEAVARLFGALEHRGRPSPRLTESPGSV
jgi:membrane-associated phospholipid phosphatase